MLTRIAFSELILCWLLWVMTFVRSRARQAGQQAVVTAHSARWGILLQGLGYGLVWGFPAVDWDILLGLRESHQQGGGTGRALLLLASMILAPWSVALVWFAVRHLGKQWRIQAGLSADHELVQTGPYRLLRHPVYASMLGMLLATGLIWTWWPILAPALAVFLAGTEIRVRAEDRLLASRFGDSFGRYRSRVRAYIPLVR